MKIKTIIFLVIIIIIGAFLRLFMIGSVPPSPDWDEAAIGYNAYSIMLTGKDEYGKFLPIVLQSFNDYKPALYVYLVIPFVKLLGLNIIAVRLPSVILGVIAICVTFALVKLIIPQNFLLFKNKRINGDTLALLTALLFAISPWHIQFSRVAFEAQVGLTLDLIALLFFFLAFRRKWFLILTSSFAALSIYVYQSEKVYIPLLFLALVIIFRHVLLAFPKKIILTSALIGFILTLPMLVYIVSNPSALTRAKGVSIFSQQTQILERAQERLNLDRRTGDTIGQILDNRRIAYTKQIIAGYISHFDPNWLFLRGDAERHQAPFMGLLYIFEIPFMLIGMLGITFLKIDRKIKYFILAYILIAPIPASITIDVPHAVRTIHFLPMLQLFVALGILMTGVYIKHTIHLKFIRFILYGFFLAFVSLNIAYYLNQYFIQQNYLKSKAWQYGWQEAVNYVWANHKKFKQVVVSNVSPLDQSYIFFLYYLKYDPVKYQKKGGTGSGGFLEKHGNIENIIFRPIDWKTDYKAKNTLFLGRPEDLPVNIDKTIYYLNGEPAMEISAKYD